MQMHMGMLEVKLCFRCYPIILGFLKFERADSEMGTSLRAVLGNQCKIWEDQTRQAIRRRLAARERSFHQAYVQKPRYALFITVQCD